MACSGADSSTDFDGMAVVVVVVVAAGADCVQPISFLVVGLHRLSNIMEVQSCYALQVLIIAAHAHLKMEPS
jgi:hypothetical protein